MSHPLHLAIANAIEQHLNGRAELIRDPACGGNQRLSLFVGPHKRNDTRMCCVDLLVILSGKVRAIVEIEESGFLPTKICGKFLQSALASNFIHDSRAEAAVPFGDEVLFVQVLDGSKCLKKGTRKDKQAALIEGRIREILPLMKSSISDYRLLFVLGEIDKVGLTSVAEAVLAAFNLTIPSD